MRKRRSRRGFGGARLRNRPRRLVATHQKFQAAASARAWPLSGNFGRLCVSSEKKPAALPEALPASQSGLLCQRRACEHVAALRRRFAYHFGLRRQRRAPNECGWVGVVGSAPNPCGAQRGPTLGGSRSVLHRRRHRGLVGFGVFWDVTRDLMKYSPEIAPCGGPSVPPAARSHDGYRGK